MELVRKFNIDLDAVDAINVANSYIDKTVQKKSNSYVKFDDLTENELSLIYNQLVEILTNEYNRLSKEGQNK